ncbi:S-layer homology domain-containing protein [Paenibacillus sp. HWE-109]|uniref:S-layer homology domain-containing protein n=1 Tax=Paenibacillus sp. HWE-109 TaxID=1306526 RepID=UPI001EDD8211|nr:S-layer homology domain-containing protein [Paenibacillus sp. HWE-109]UKS25920.1 S-layer homology domain-containing protein [Paenibacillus sp. HWE-109]
MKPLKLILTFTIALSVALTSLTIAPIGAFAEQSSIVLSDIPTISPGGTVTITGTSTNSEVIIKVIRPTGGILFFDIVKVTNGKFSDTFVLGSSELPGTYQVVTGQADTVASKDLVVKAPAGAGGGSIGGGGGGGQAANTVTPANVQIHASAITSNKVTGPDGKVTTAVSIDNKFLSDAFVQLKEQGKPEQTPIIGIKIGNIDANGTTNVSLPASVLIEGMKNSNAVIRIYSDKESYFLPLNVLNFDEIARSLGTDSSKVTFHVNISVAGNDLEKQIQESAGKKGASSLGHSVDFSIVAEGNGQTKELKDFGTNYVNRSISYTGTVDPKTSTGVLYDPTEQEISFVPSVFGENAEGKQQVTIKRNGNSIYGVVTSSKTFNDVKSHWAKSDIELLASKLVVSGATDSDFAPDHAITRAEFATLLVRALALTADASAASFKDVQATDWYAGSIGAAVKSKLVSGYEDGTFQPNAQITREQMAVMVAKALSAAGLTVDSQPELLNKFTDNSQISDWAKASVSQSVKAGIISGMTDTTFVASANASRAQAAVMLKRLLQYAKFIN